MAICVYCGEVASTSREHIISASVLDLFGDTRHESCFVYDVLGHECRSRRGIIIKDVCIGCNSTLSRLDDRGKQIVTKIINSELQTLEERLDARLLAWLIKTHLNWLRQAKLTAGIDFDTDRSLYEHVMVAANLNISTFRRWSFAHLFYRYRDINFLYPWADQGVGATKQRLNPVSYELLFIKESRIVVSCLFLHGLLHVFLLRRNGATLTKKDVNEVKGFFRKAVKIGAPLELIEVPWISQNCTANLRISQGHPAHLYYGATLVAPWGEKTDDLVLVKGTAEPRKNGGFRIRQTTLYRWFSATIYVENDDQKLKLYWLSPFVLLKLGSFTVKEIQPKIYEMSNPSPAC